LSGNRKKVSHEGMGCFSDCRQSKGQGTPKQCSQVGLTGQLLTNSLGRKEGRVIETNREGGGTEAARKKKNQCFTIKVKVSFSLKLESGPTKKKNACQIEERSRGVNNKARSFSS